MGHHTGGHLRGVSLASHAERLVDHQRTSARGPSSRDGPLREAREPRVEEQVLHLHGMLDTHDVAIASTRSVAPGWSGVAQVQPLTPHPLHALGEEGGNCSGCGPVARYAFLSSSACRRASLIRTPARIASVPSRLRRPTQDERANHLGMPERDPSAMWPPLL